MADVRPLRGVRYNPQRQANIGRLIAPPYDTAPDRLNGNGRLSFNIAEIENVDLAPGENSHRVAATRYHDWLDQGLLLRDAEPAFYVHDHAYHDGDVVRHRRGLLARVRLTPWREGIILPHERTFPGPRQERLERIRAVQANLSPLYLLYHDETGAVPELLNTSVDQASPVATGQDAKGGEHRLTMITDPQTLAELTRRFANERLLVADGHHRYEAALAYRDEQRRPGSVTGDDAPSDFVLAMLADTADPGVQVLPTHRVVTGLTDFDRDQFRQKLESLFEVETHATLESEPRRGLICEILLTGEPGPWRVYRRPGDAHASLLPRDRGESWRGLDVAISDHVILLGLLGVDASDRTEQVTYTHDVATAWQMVNSGGSQLALLHAQPSLADLARVAAEGDTLPPKSTFFEPKPPAGLVINDLRQS